MSYSNMAFRWVLFIGRDICLDGSFDFPMRNKILFVLFSVKIFFCSSKYAFQIW